MRSLCVAERVSTFAAIILSLFLLPSGRAAAAGGNFYGSSAPLSVPDNDATGITSSVVVPSGLATEIVAVTLYITHTSIGDLHVSLTHLESNQTVDLVPESFECTGDNLTVTFTNGVPTTTLDCSTTITPASRRLQIVDQLDNVLQPGTCTLRVRDLSPGEVGTLDKWWITCDSSHTVTRPALQSFGLGTLSAAGWTSDPRVAYTVGSQGVALWSADTFEKIRTIPTGPLSELIFTPEGGRFFGRAGNGYQQWELTTGANLGDWGAQFGTPPTLLSTSRRALSQDGAYYVALENAQQESTGLQVFEHGVGEIWATSTNPHYTAALMPGSAYTRGFVFRGQSHQFASFGADGTAKLWDPLSQSLIRTFNPGTTSIIRAASFSPDGSRLVTAAQDRTVNLWNVASGDQISSTTLTALTTDGSLGFSPDGTLVFVRTNIGLELLDSATLSPAHFLSAPNSVTIRGNPVTSDSSKVVVPLSDRSVDVRDVATGATLGTLEGHTVTMSAADFVGTDLIMTQGDGSTPLWLARSGNIIGALPPGEVRKSRGGRYALIGDGSPLIIYDTETSSTIAAIPSGNLLNAFINDDTEVVTINDDVSTDTATVWSTLTGSLVSSSVVTLPSALLTKQFISPDGATFVTSNSTQARFFDLYTGAERYRVRSDFSSNPGGGPTDFVDVDYLPDSSAFVTSRRIDPIAALFDAATGKEISRFLVEPYFPGLSLGDFSLTADGESLLVEDPTDGLRIIDLATGVHKLTMGSGGVEDSTLSPDGTRVLRRLNGFAELVEVDTPRAIIVAAGDPDAAKNALVAQTRALGGYSGNVLLSRGVARSDMRILSSHLGLGSVDVNGDAIDDTDLLLTKDSLRTAILDWPNEGAFAGRRLLIHMLDHGIREGGETLFILNGCETLPSSELDSWLDQLQDPLQNNGLVHEVTLVIDCCYSGEFVQSCSPTGSQRRTVVASTTEEDLAVFLPPPDLTSFSSSFFGAAYMGASIRGSFDAASDFFQTFEIGNQQPQMTDEAGGSGTASGYLGASWIYAGSGRGFEFFGDLGVATTSPSGTLSPGSMVTLSVTVNSIGDPSSVLAQVIPPAPDLESGQPVTESLQTITLTNTSGRTWQGTYAVEEEGTYVFGIYGRYADNRRSKPEVVQVSVVEPDPEEQRPLVALIAAGQLDPSNQTGPLDDQALKLSARAYLTAEARGFLAADTRLFGPVQLSALGTPLPQPPTVANFSAEVSSLAGGHAGEKLFISLIGPLAGTGEFLLAPGELLSAATLDALLDSVEASDAGAEAIILIDTPNAGSFVPVLESNRRIVIAGTTASGPGFFLKAPTYQSFSRRFLEASRQGRDLYNSYLAGKDFSQVFVTPPPVISDGLGLPVPQRAVGKFLGRRGVFASDAGELATICDVAPDQNVTTLIQAAVFVDLLGGLPPVSVTAEAVPNPPTSLVSGSDPVGLVQDPFNPSRWQIAPEDLTRLISAAGNWIVSYEAEYASATPDLPRNSQNEKTQLSIGQNNALPDVFDAEGVWMEDSGAMTLNVLVPRARQRHTLHEEADEDWMRAYQYFPGPTAVPYSLTFTNLVIPVGSQLQVEVYRNGPASPADIVELIPPGLAARSISFTGTDVAEIHVRVSISGPTSPATAYDIVWTDDGGANNGIASATGSDTIQLAVDSQGLDAALDTRSVRGSAEPGFRILRSLTGLSGSYASVNAVLLGIPPPSSFGPCPPPPCPCLAPGCVNYTDSGLAPATVYFYHVDLVRSDLSTVPWRGPFYGYTLPVGASELVDWNAY